MKKILGLAVALFFVSSVSFAQGKVVIGLGGNVGIPMSTEVAKQVNVGFGGMGHVGYAIGDLLTIGLSGGYRSYSLQIDPYRDLLYSIIIGEGAPVSVAEDIASNASISGSLDMVPILAELRCNFMSGQVKPYGFLGVGVALNNMSMKATFETMSITGSASEIAFLLSPGLGVAFAASDNVDIFVQGGVDLDFTSNNGSITGKMTMSDGTDSITMEGPTNLTGDSPTIFIPFEVGVQFSLQ